MKKIKLGDVCTINAENYSDIDSYDFVNYLDTGNITANHIENIQRIDITQDKLPSRARRRVKFNSIIYSTVRPIQRHYGIIKSLPENFLVSTGFTVIDADPEKIDANFLYYQLSRDEVVNNLQSIADQSTTAYPSIKPSDLSNLEFYVPSLETQHRMGNFLYAIDDKIALNKKINATLEAMARTLYDYWFVQFDFPDENGKPYKTSGGKMIFSSELGRDIPADWKVDTLETFGTLKNGINYDKNTIGDCRVKIVNVKDISNSSFSIATESLDDINLPEEQTRKYLTTMRDFLIARSGIPGAVRTLADENFSSIYCGFIICFQPRNELWKNFLIFTLQKHYEIISTQSAGTIMQNITQDTLKNFRLIVPPLSVLEKFNHIVEPMISEMNKNILESRRLATLSEWLLPMLMNGQVNFKETWYNE